MAINPHFHHTDQQLLDELAQIEAAKSDPVHFAPLYTKYYKQIFGYIYQRMESRDAACDVTSQVFLKALSKISRYEYKGVPFGSWLYRIAHNEVMQVYRKSREVRAVNADVGDLRFITEHKEEKYFEEYIPAIKELIAKLSASELHLVEMRFFEKRPFKEIAEILEITEVNAKVRMYRIVEKLKRSIQKIKT